MSSSSSVIPTKTPGIILNRDSENSDSHYPSVFSELTMEEDDDGYFFHQHHASANSVLEYSDDTPSDHEELSPKRNHSRGSRFRVRRDSVSPNNSEEGSGSNKTKQNWMKRWTSSFRSPSNRMKKPHHKRANSSVMEEYPHYSSSETAAAPVVPSLFPEVYATEQSPLVTKHQGVYGHGRAIFTAAALLQDYEAGRPASFLQTDDITDEMLAYHQFRHSWVATIARTLACICFALASFMEGTIDGDRYPYHQRIATMLNFFAVAVFGVDVYSQRNGYHSRTARLIKPMGLFCMVLFMENLCRVWLVPGDMVIFSSIFKPLALFYVSSQARDAFSAVRRILKIVLRVLLMELLLILMFASVACRMFSDYEGFESLGQAWLSLFELATTVVNPSIWMPIYRDSRFSALFFVAFIVVTAFYLHSLVLSVVFQTYIQAAGEIHERNSADREDAVHLAFLVLCQDGSIGVRESGDVEKKHVSIEDVRETLRLMRPHYNPMKINALVAIVDPSNQGMVDFTSFRTKIRQALNASVRTARNPSLLAMSVELVAATMAVVNFVYVMLVSSPFSETWFENIQMDVGCLITLMGAFELLIRFNPLRVDFTPLIRINVAFDGSALLAAIISGVGVFMYFAGMPSALEYILIGRSLDIIRALRFFEIFRDVVRRTSDVVPALAGPVILVVSTLHIFVYFGMAFWGGAIDVGTHEGLIEDLYDLNNFNSYQEGMVTMFQVLVVNDWHAIAQVFQFANRCSSNFIVFPFFISANLFGVSVMLNVLTAFFVESFVTKLHNDVDAPAEDTTTVHNKKERDFSIETSTRKAKRIAHSAKKKRNSSLDHGTESHGADADSECSSTSEKFEFDVYEREGYDKIMQTVSAAQGLYDGDMARNICAYLEIFESLTPGREPVGYLICDQRTLERFGNRRFKSKSIGFLDENRLHGVVTDMHAELLALATKVDFEEKSLIRSFQHRRDPNRILEISASLLRRQPALSLFVARSYHQHAGRTPPLAGHHHKR